MIFVPLCLSLSLYNIYIERDMYVHMTLYIYTYMYVYIYIYIYKYIGGEGWGNAYM